MKFMTQRNKVKRTPVSYNKMNKINSILPFFRPMARTVLLQTKRKKQNITSASDTEKACMEYILLQRRSSG